MVRFAFDTDIAARRLYQSPCNPKAKASTAKFTRERTVDGDKVIENPVHVVFCDPQTGVADAEFDQIAGPDHFGLDPHNAVAGKFNRVADKVQQHLTQCLWIAQHRWVPQRAGVNFDLGRICVRHCALCFNDLLDQFIKDKRLGFVRLLA